MHLVFFWRFYIKIATAQTQSKRVHQCICPLLFLDIWCQLQNTNDFILWRTFDFTVWTHFAPSMQSTCLVFLLFACFYYALYNTALAFPKVTQSPLWFFLPCKLLFAKQRQLSVLTDCILLPPLPAGKPSAWCVRLFQRPRELRARERYTIGWSERGRGKEGGGVETERLALRGAAEYKNYYWAVQ